MDFYKIVEKTVETGPNKGSIVVRPEFKVGKSKDLMIRGKSFYAVWNEAKGLWSTDEYDVAPLIDNALLEYFESRGHTLQYDSIKLMKNFSSGMWKDFRSFMNHLSDNAKPLDERIIFANTEVKKDDYASKRLPYSLMEGETAAYDEIASTLYDPEERAKLEWAVGAIISGEAKHIQKFLVLYGAPGSGKSTYLNIVEKLFEGYYTGFDVAALTSLSNNFSAEMFRTNPLVAIDHDADLSRIEKNSLLNSIISHENIIINEKNKSAYSARVNAFLLIGTNKPVKITDAKSGLIRRLIDVNPSGRLIPTGRYHVLTAKVEFELGAIANHCLQVYRRMGKDYFSGYRPEEMMLQTDPFYNYIEYFYDVFKSDNGTTLARAYDLYKVYCDDSGMEFKLPRHKFRDELRNYFEDFHDRVMVDGERYRSYYQGFRKDKFGLKPVEEHAYSLTLDESDSLLDEMLAGQPAQYAKWSEKTKSEIPSKQWLSVKTTLADLDTKEVHYVKVPANHIVIDFDLKDENGEKSAELNIAAASAWPTTYAEWSKGGSGIHLHYLYSGDVSKLSNVFSEGVEVKTLLGDSSLRRRLSGCNNIPVAELHGGLPLKEEKVIDADTVRSEKALRALVERNLRKEIHPGTKPSVDFIHKILEDAHSSGLVYDLTDMRPRIMAFANNSTNQADYCLRMVLKMKYKSDEEIEPKEPSAPTDERLVIYDVEVFPNLFIVCWKYRGGSEVVRMINPSPQEMEALLRLKLVGFYNRKYDNHIIWGRYMGLSIRKLYELSQKLISNERSAPFGEAYNLSYTDIYDFCSAANKKSLKRWQIELGLHHQELGLPWDQEVPDTMIEKVAEYCANDVITTEQVLDHVEGDWVARQILAELSGLSVNDTTNRHSTRIIFGDNKEPQKDFVYTDLSEMFPGYTYDYGKSSYRGEDPGEGGYVYSEPGMYSDVVVLDIASMHPTSIEQLNLFGPYTKIFSDLKKARVLIKHGELDKASKLMDGKLGPFLKGDGDLKALSDALKTVINSVYGLTSAKFDNPFRDIRNVDNIVAKRGALFMIELKHVAQERGLQVVHIKTDSIKIPGASPEDIEFVSDFGKKYGYDFEYETTYEKMCLVNDAVFIAKDHKGWHATGAQFAHPYVFKHLFSKEPIDFDDMTETKAVTTALYLDSDFEKNIYQIEDNATAKFVGRIGRFCPMKPGTGGSLLLREKEGRLYAVGGTKGYQWMEAEVVKELGKEGDIDGAYFAKLVDESISSLEKYGDVGWFLD